MGPAKTCEKTRIQFASSIGAQIVHLEDFEPCGHLPSGLLPTYITLT